jgi:hypothetical protein
MQRKTAVSLILGAVIILAVGAAIYLFVQRARADDFGPAVALCPGPDLYGYTCAGGDGFAAIDATEDTGLYEDDGLVTLELPFVFTFYGTEFTEVQASSNGTLQFGSGLPAYANICLTDGPDPMMGDMIAPFWDDFDLTFTGFLETAVSGEEPNRIFVVEWDGVARYGGSPEDTVTFSAQLFEGSSDILFFYEDVETLEDSNGRSATIGLQSAAQGVALQYSCDQAAVNTGRRLLIAHPENANASLGREDVLYRPQETAGLTAKGETADLITALNQRGPAIMAAMQRQWLNQSPQRMSEWVWLEEENGRSGNISVNRAPLLLLWRGPQNRPDLTQLILLSPDENGDMILRFNHRFATRATPNAQIELVEIADLTSDNQPDMLLRDATSGSAFVFTTASGEPARHTLPETCSGSIAIQNKAIIRDHCQTDGRFAVAWNGTQFTAVATSK